MVNESIQGTPARAAVVVCAGVRKTYGTGRGSNVALDGVDVEIAPGEIAAVVGPSGSGKSTLLHVIGAMDRPDSGRVVVSGRDVTTMTDADASRFRRERLGFVFQFFNLIPALSALDNVALPARLCGVSALAARARAHDLLGRMALADRADEYPDALSGGQQQRVAIARALVNDPELILADEPTGALDSRAGGRVLEFLGSVVRERGATLVMVTHSELALDFASRCIRIEDGRIVDGDGGGEAGGDGAGHGAAERDR